MQQKELNIRKQQNSLLMQSLEKRTKILKQQPDVQEFFAKTKKIGELEKEQEFISNLEVGDDNSIFGPYNEDKINSFSNLHFGLIDVLHHAFTLKHYNRRILFELQKRNSKLLLHFPYSISYDELDAYIENATKKLTDFRHIEGDRKIENPYGIEVYENPKNYSIVDFKSISKVLTQEVLERDYQKCNIRVYSRLQVFELVGLDSFMKLTKTKKLTRREQIALYGSDAQKALDLTPRKIVKEKVYRK